jgi:hypothetical protein
MRSRSSACSPTNTAQGNQHAFSTVVILHASSLFSISRCSGQPSHRTHLSEGDSRGCSRSGERFCRAQAACAREVVLLEQLQRNLLALFRGMIPEYHREFFQCMYCIEFLILVPLKFYHIFFPAEGILCGRSRRTLDEMTEGGALPAPSGREVLFRTIAKLAAAVREQIPLFSVVFLQ